MAQAVTMVPSGSRGGDTDLTPPSQWSSDKTDFNKTIWDGICLDAAIFGKYICYSKYHKYRDTVIRILITALFTITKQ